MAEGAKAGNALVRGGATSTSAPPAGRGKKEKALDVDEGGERTTRVSPARGGEGGGLERCCCCCCCCFCCCCTATAGVPADATVADGFALLAAELTWSVSARVGGASVRASTLSLASSSLRRLRWRNFE
jgi:hypothetical protein